MTDEDVDRVLKKVKIAFYALGSVATAMKILGLI